MLLSYNKLNELIFAGVITADPENVNSASIDLTLDNVIHFEALNESKSTVVDLAKKESISTRSHEMTEDGFVILPGQGILAASREIFRLPTNISAEYKLKSTMARNFLEHLNAGWCDAGWNGSKLTLELVNLNRYHSIRIRPGMKIGQIVFFEHEHVPADKSYAAKGQYNGDTVVTPSKGLR